MGSLEERILDALQELGEDEFSAFKERLRHPDNLGGLKAIPWCELEKAGRLETSWLIKQTYTSDHAPQVMGKVLEKSFPEICEVDGMEGTSSSTSRRWKPGSQRWRPQFGKLAKTDCELVKFGEFGFGENKEFLIGRGSNGSEVYLGLADDGTEVAVKKVTIRNLAALKNERTFLQKLDHSSIVKYVDYAEDKNFGYLALELCEYTLEEYMCIHHPSERERKQLANQVLQSLKVLHCQNPTILHRDIKPQNVFIDIEGRARLADFGISLELEEGNTSICTSPAGTKSWKARETLEDDPVFYRRSTDIQVAGMLIYYILSEGHHPFGSGIKCEVNIHEGIYNLDNVQDEAAKNLIEWMINKDPEKRPTVEECLDHHFWFPTTAKIPEMKSIQRGNYADVRGVGKSSGPLSAESSRPPQGGESTADRMSSGTSASIRGKNRDPSELRIVLIGGSHGGEPSGKSSVGNIILGRDVFKTNRTTKSVMRQELVLGRQVSVVDTPGWRSSLPLDLTPKLTHLEIQQSVNLCPPGPHAFVLVIRLDAPYAGTGMSAEEHVRFLLGDRVWKHAIVVFTVAGRSKMRPDLIRSDPELRYLTEKCEGRFHVLNISDRGDGSQVTELLQKVDQMTSNGHYETEEHVSEELKEMERSIRRKAEQRRADTQKQSTGLPNHTGLTDIRIVLLGEQSSGKSSAGNTILTGSGFKVSQTGQRSGQCEVRQGEVAGRHVTVVDSPGWFYNRPLQDTSEMDKLEIQNSVSLCPPGPHAALLTVPLHTAFTKAQRVALEEHLSLHPESVWSYSMILFTHEDRLGDRSIEEHIEAEGEDLCWLVGKCGNRYHVLNNQKTDVTQVTQLLEKVEDMVSGNTGGHYEDDGDEKMTERKRNIQERVHTFMTKTHRQRNALKALSEGAHQSLSDVRLMLAGGEQDVRNRAANHILQDDAFTVTTWKEFKTQTKLTQCVRQQRRVADRTVSVVNCPDWSTTPPSQKIKDVLLHGVTLCSPGPHAVLVTVDVRSSFSEADRRSVEEQMELLGDRFWRVALVLFMMGYWLGGRRVEEYMESEGEPLRWLLEKCGYRYHILHGLKRDISEVKKLLEKTEDMVRNRGHVGPSRQKTLFERLKRRKTLSDKDWNRREEEWKKREEEMMERVLRAVVTEPEGPTLPEERKKREQEMRERMLRFVATEPEEPSLSAGSRWNIMDLEELSVGTPSETGSLSSWSPLTDKVSSSLSSSCHGSIAPSSGYGSSLTVYSSSGSIAPSSGYGSSLTVYSSSGSIAPSSGHGNMSDVLSQASADDRVQRKMFQRLTGKTRRTEEDWNRRQEQWRRREQDMKDRILEFVEFVLMEPDEPSLAAVRRRTSMDLSPPSICYSLLGILQQLGAEDFMRFQWYLERSIPRSRLKCATTRAQTVDLITQAYPGGRAVLVTQNLLEKMGRHDLAGILSYAVSGVGPPEPTTTKSLSVPATETLSSQGTLHAGSGRSSAELKTVWMRPSRLLAAFFKPSPVQVWVALFYTPPIDDDDPTSTLNVLLLPGNVVLEEVINRRRERFGEEIYIEKPPCKLIPNQEYTLSTSPQDDSIIIEPKKATFQVDESSNPHYFSTFEVILKRRFKRVELFLRDSKTSVSAWDSSVNFSAPAIRRQQVQHTLTLSAERLFSVRASFIDRISLHILNSLLDKLFTKEVLTDAERETADGMQSRNDKARFVIDTVRRKGSAASSAMIVILCDLDPLLSEHLGLR